MKKLIIILTIILTAFNTYAAKWYVSAAGNDALAGTSQGAAWKTIAKVNASWASINAGDTIFFRKGDTWNEALVIGKSGTSGNPIVISSYGTGAKPVITGYQTLTGFTNPSTGIYQKSFTAGKQNFINLEFDGVMQRFARTPNAGVTPYYYEAGVRPTTTTTTITDNQLPAIAGRDTSEVVVRKAAWVWERGKVTTISGNALTYGLTGNNVNGSAGVFFDFFAGVNWGYFFQNLPSALDQNGEFYFQKYDKVISVFSSDAITNHTVRASAIDKLINLNGFSYITIENLSLEGANISAIYGVSGSNATIKNNTISKSGAMGIQLTNISNTLIQGNDIDWSLSTGIQAICNSTNVFSNTVNHTFLYEGMGDYGSDGSCLRGMVIRGNDLNIQFNTVLNSGYSGVNFQGNNVLVQNNYILNPCQTQSDNGGIYVYVGNENAYGAPSTIYTNRTIRGNVIVSTSVGNSGYGEKIGTSSIYISGIYTDGKTQNILIDSNTTIGFKKGGIISNNPTNIEIRGNTFYDDSMGIRRLTRRNYDKQFLETYRITGNIFIPKVEGQVNFYYYTDSLFYANAGQEISKVNKLDSNYTLSNSILYRSDITGNSVAPMSLTGFQAFSTEEANTTSIKSFPEYTITNLGVNKYPNPFFTTNITGVVTYSATGSWDNTNQINGGTYKVVFPTSTPESYNNTFAPVGAVSGKYLVRFKTKGTQANGILRVFFANAASPTVAITPLKYSNYGTTIKQHEFVFDVPSIGSANLAIAFDRSSGATYLDDVEVLPATAIKNDLADSLKFIYSTTDTTIVTLSYKYKDVFGKVYNGGQDTVLPYRSKLYIYESATTGTPVIVPVITSSLTASGNQAVLFNYTIIASNAPVSYSATGLPTGLSINTSTGLISGTPSVSGTFNVTIGATNTAGTDTETLVITLVAIPTPPAPSPYSKIKTTRKIRN